MEMEITNLCANFFSLNIFYVDTNIIYHFWIFGCAHCNNLTTNPHRLRAVSVCVSTGLMWRWEGCRLADDHRVHARGVSGWRWRGGREQQVGLGLLAQTVVVQRPRRVCVLQSLGVLILRIRQQWAFCTTWNHKWQVYVHSDTKYVTRAGKMSRNEQIFKYVLFLFSHSPLKYLQNMTCWNRTKNDWATAVWRR